MYVYVLGTRWVGCAKTGELIEMPFGRLSHAGSRNHVFDGGQDWTNPLAALMSDKSTMRPICQLTLDTYYYSYY